MSYTVIGQTSTGENIIQTSSDDTVVGGGAVMTESTYATRAGTALRQEIRTGRRSSRGQRKKLAEAHGTTVEEVERVEKEYEQARDKAEFQERARFEATKQFAGLYSDPAKQKDIIEQAGYEVVFKKAPVGVIDKTPEKTGIEKTREKGRELQKEGWESPSIVYGSIKIAEGLGYRVVSGFGETAKFTKGLVTGESWKSLAYVVKHPVQTSKEFTTQFSRDPLGQSAEFIGGGGFFKVLGKVGSGARKFAISKTGVEVPAESLVRPDVLSGKARFPMSTDPASKVQAKFKSGKYAKAIGEAEGGFHATGKGKSIEFTIKTGKGRKTDVEGLYIAPDVSKHFLREGAGGGYSGISLVPKFESGGSIEFLRTRVGRIPKSIKKKGKTSAVKSFSEEGWYGSGKARLTPDVEFKRGGKVEDEAVVSAKSRFERFDMGDWRQTILGSKYYTKIDDEIIPIRKYKHTGEGVGFGKVKSKFTSKSSKSFYSTDRSFPLITPSRLAIISSSGRSSLTRSSVASEGAFHTRYSSILPRDSAPSEALRSFTSSVSSSKRYTSGFISSGGSGSGSSGLGGVFAVGGGILKPPSKFSTFKTGSTSKKKKKRLTGFKTAQPKQYTPTVTSAVFQIRGRPSKTRTGLGIRPIPKRRKKNGINKSRL